MKSEFMATASVVLDMPRATVWEYMRDLSLAKCYVPGVLDCRLTTDRITGVGASRRVYMKHFELDETVVEWNEGKGFTLRLHNGNRPPLIFTQAFADYRIDDSVDGILIEHSLRYVMRGGPLGVLVARLGFHKMMLRSASDVVLNLGKFYRARHTSDTRSEQGAVA